MIYFACINVVDIVCIVPPTFGMPLGQKHCSVEFDRNLIRLIPCCLTSSVTVGHPDSTEVSNNAGLAGETVLPENSNPEQGQGDNGKCSGDPF